MAETKECPNCEAKIGATETTCPACNEDLEILEESISTVTKVNSILAKRKAKETPPEPEVKTEKKLSIFRKIALKKKEKK